MKNEILRFFHCRKCVLAGLPGNIEAGITHSGVQVWCKTHDANVVAFTIEQLRERVAHPPDCEHCR